MATADAMTARTYISAAFLGILISACTMSMPADTAKSSDAYRDRATERGLTLAIHPVTDPSEMDQAFAINLKEQGILPILVVAENHSPDQSFVLTTQQMSLVDAGGTAATGAMLHSTASEQTGKVLSVIGAGGVLGLVGIKMVSNSTVIKHNIQDKAFNDSTLDPGQSAHGFLYYSWPPSGLQTTRRDLVVEALITPSGKPVDFRLPVAIGQ